MWHAGDNGWCFAALAATYEAEYWHVGWDDLHTLALVALIAALLCFAWRVWTWK